MEAIGLIGILVALVLGTIVFYKWKFTFWSQRNLPTLPPKIPFGTMREIIMREASPGEAVKNIYLRSKAKGYKHTGTYLFFVPEYMVIDPEIIKCILQKDFHNFTNRVFYYNEKHDPMSANLLTIRGKRWKTLRHQLSPTFSSGKIKTMFEIMLACGDQLVEAVDHILLTAREEVDMKEIAACYTTDIIGSCAFGLNCNSFKSEHSEFTAFRKQLLEPLSGLRSIQIVFALFQPKIARILGIKLLPPQPAAYFRNVIEQTVEFREKNNVDRKDMLKLLIELKNSEDGFSVKEIAAQSLLFFTASFETSSSTITFCLYELSRNRTIQEKVREEINSVLKAQEGRIFYESIIKMKYLHRVVQETLRKYPPLPFISRECEEDYCVPGTDVVIPKGINVTVPIMGIHHDPEYYPNPDEFDPDRFLPEVEEKRPHFTYLPFGEGPRICIALRFGYLKTKIGLINLLKNYKFTVNKKTVEPIEFEKNFFILSSEKGIFFNVEKV